MKKLLLAFFVLLFHNSIYAQPWMQGYGANPVKFSEALKNYQRSSAKTGADKIMSDGKEVVKEDDNYQFDRWAWYWSQHLDKDGYIVPPAQTIRAWQKYTDAHAPKGAARTAAVASNWIFQGPRHCEGGYSGL